MYLISTNLFLVRFSTSLLIVQYFLPLAIISVAYARIAFRLWGSKTPGAAQTDRDHNILLNKKKVSNNKVLRDFWIQITHADSNNVMGSQKRY